MAFTGYGWLIVVLILLVLLFVVVFIVLLSKDKTWSKRVWGMFGTALVLLFILSVVFKYGDKNHLKMMKGGYRGGYRGGNSGIADVSLGSIMIRS